MSSVVRRMIRCCRGGERQVSRGWASELVGERGLPGGCGIRAMLEAHPAVSPQENGILYYSLTNIQAHTAKAAVRVAMVQSECISSVFKRVASDVVRRVEVPNPPHDGKGRVVRTRRRPNGKLSAFLLRQS